MSKLETYKKIKDSNNPAYDRLLDIYKQWIKEQRFLANNDDRQSFVSRQKKVIRDNKYN